MFNLKKKAISIRLWVRQQFKKILIGLGIIGIAVTAIGVIPPDIPEHALLKAPVADILGMRERVDHVKYAYKTNEINDSKKEDLFLRTPNAVVYEVDRKIIDKEVITTYRADVFAGVPQFYEAPNGKWYQVDYATTTKKYFDRQISKNTIFPIALAASPTSTFAGAAASASLGITNQTVTWVSMRDRADSDNASDSGTTVNIRLRTANATQWWGMSRGSLGFAAQDVLPADATLTSSTIYINGDSKGDNLTLTPAHYVVSHSPATTTDIVVADFASSTFGTIIFASTSYADLPDGDTYLAIPLNASGLAHISTTTDTSFGTMSNWDFDDVEPSFSAANQSYWQTNWPEATGTSTDPYISITFSVSTAARRVFLVK